MYEWILNAKANVNVCALSFNMNWWCTIACTGTPSQYNENDKCICVQSVHNRMPSNDEQQMKRRHMKCLESYDLTLSQSTVASSTTTTE